MNRSDQIFLIPALLLAGILLGTSSVFSQISQSNVFDEYKSIKAREFGMNAGKSKISGSPYENEDYRSAIIKNFKGDSVSTALRYNIFQDEMEFSDGKDIFWLNKLRISNIIFSDRAVYVPIAYKDGDKIVNFWFELLVSGNYSLLKKRLVVFKEAEKPGAYKEAKPDRFERQGDEYYLRKGEEAPVLIRNKKDIEAAFPQLKDAISTLKARFGRENELIEMVNNFNLK